MKHAIRGMVTIGWVIQIIPSSSIFSRLQCSHSEVVALKFCCVAKKLSTTHTKAVSEGTSLNFCCLCQYIDHNFTSIYTIARV